MMRSFLIVLLSVLSTTLAISCYIGRNDSYLSIDCTLGEHFERNYCVKVTSRGVAERSCSFGFLCSSDGCTYSNGDAYCCCSTNYCNLTSTNSPFVAFAAVVLFALYLLK